MWGEAWSTSANIYGGEFTADPNVSSWFSNSTARSNAIGENAAHELDHILRGVGHSKNPGDINCEGTLVPASLRAQDNRSFTAADQQQKVKNLLSGASYKPYNAKDEKQNFNVMAVFGGTGWPEELKPDCTWVTISVELMAAPEMFAPRLHDRRGRMGLLRRPGSLFPACTRPACRRGCCSISPSSTC